jgi:tRNA threonylcarbamoyladenosine biosynthesis protein TsaB
MTVLALDTATRATAVAVCDQERGVVLEARDDPPPGSRPRHATRLLPLVDELLQRYAQARGRAADWEAIDALAVGTGPGTFTGLRIGIATARALAQARDIPLTGISTLRSLALNACGTEESAAADLLVAVLDARRGEVFACAWEPAAVMTGHPQLAPVALAPETLAHTVSARWARALAIGDGSVEFRAILEHSGISVPGGDSALHRVTAINHCRLVGTVPVTPSDRVEPQYLRIPDAEINRRASPSE